MAKLPLRKALLFSGVTLVLFFGMLEVVLGLAGIRPVTVREDPYVGFSSYLKLYRPVASGQELETAPNKLALFNPQTFSRRKKAGTMRVFTVGGSTTYGRPFEDPTSFSGWLRATLAAVDDDREWEVINAGGISYASYRVAALMEELVQYEPDLFVIYSGNNEFLEKRTYGDLFDEPAPLQRTRSLLRHSRLWALGRRILDSRRAAARRHYEMTGEVQELLDTSAGLDRYERDETFEGQVLEHYRFNLQRMIDLAEAHGARVILVTVPVNGKDFAPFKSQHREGISPEARRRHAELLARAREELQDGGVDRARLAAAEAVELDPEFANGQFVLGRALLAAGQLDRAALAFARAVEEDVCPLRALPEINDAILQAGARNDVEVVDFRALIRAGAKERTGFEVPGDEFFLDHVHPTVEAHGILAGALVEQMAGAGMLAPAPDWRSRIGPLVAAEISARVDTAARARAYKNLSKVLIWAGKKEEAEKYVRQAEALLPGDWEVQYNAGKIQAEVGAHDRAIEHFQQASRLNPSRAEPHDRLGAVYAELGRLEQAVEEGRRATSIEPSMAGAWSNLGTYYRAAGQADLALAATGKAIELDPGSAEAHSNLGNVYFDLGRPGDALRSYERAIALRARFPEAIVSRGLVLGQLGRFDEALQAFADALALDPELPTAHVGRGKVLLARENLDGAIAAFERAVLGDTRHVEGHEMLARALAMDSRPVDASRVLENGIRANPDALQLHLLSGRLLAQSGNYDRAARAFSRAIELEPRRLEPKIDLAALQVSAGKYDEAIESCRRFLETSAGSDALHHILANALLLVNRVEEAQIHLQRAFRLNPDNALAASDLAAVHEHYGRLDEALELYLAAARIDPNLAQARESATRLRQRLGQR